MMVPKISAQLFSKFLLTGTFALMPICNAIASEIPTENLKVENHTNISGVIAKTQPSFSDVSGHWAQVYIEALASRGFLAGYTY
jgi:S-layer homology domain